MTWMTWFQGANVFPLVLRRWECTWNVCCVRQHAPPLNHIILLCLLFVWSFGVCLGCWMYIHWIHVFIYISIFIQFIYIYVLLFSKGCWPLLPLWNHQKVQLYAALLNVGSFVLELHFWVKKTRHFWHDARFPRMLVVDSWSIPEA